MSATDKLTPEGQTLEDAATLRRLARELESVARRRGRHHGYTLLRAADDLTDVAYSLDGRR